MTRFDDEDEWLPWYWKRFWRSKAVARMSDSAALLYKWLLDYQWEHEHLEPPDAMRRVVPGRFATKWKKLWAEIQSPDGPCFVADEQGNLRNEALAHEREIAMVIRKANSARASLGGKARARRLAEAELEERFKQPETCAPSCASSTTPSAPGAALGASTSPDSTRPERPTPTPPVGRGVGDVIGVISGIDPANGVGASAVRAAVERAGFEVQADVRIPDRGDGREGVVDLHVVAPPCWIQVDPGAEPRQKSLEKLRACPGNRVLVLGSAARGAIPAHRWPGITAAVGLGGACVQPAVADPHRALREDKPLWMQLGYASEAAFREADTLRAQPKPKLLELLHEKRNGTAVHAGGGTCPS